MTHTETHTSLSGFVVHTPDGSTLRFSYYLEEAPFTCEAFDAQLPFSRKLVHARLSGQEIWTDQAPELDIVQENASVFTQPGEVVIGPLRPLRAKTSCCMGIYYGEGKGLDSCNIFARVFDEDAGLLQELGEDIWKKGIREVTFDKMHPTVSLP
jgi:hypothetical protein